MRPSLTLGQKFQPGSSRRKFCMPTSVAVACTGEVFVADGYCNSRVLKFDDRGDLIRVFPHTWGITFRLIYSFLCYFILMRENIVDVMIFLEYFSQYKY